jgi:hypothetical protein
VARRVHSSHRPLDPLPLALPSQRHSTALPSPKRYDKRYELGCCANFLELRVCELPRILLMRTSQNSYSTHFVNKGEKNDRIVCGPKGGS